MLRDKDKRFSITLQRSEKDVTLLIRREGKKAYVKKKLQSKIY